MNAILLKKIGIVSRYTLLILIIQCMSCAVLLAHKSSAQKVDEVHISVDWQNVALKEALKSLETETDFEFFFDDEKIGGVKNISLKANNESLKKILLQLSKEKGLKFKRLNKVISVIKLSEKEEFLAIEELDLNDVEISGKITDEKGQGLPGASIVQAGTSTGTTTDLDGNYKLSVSEGATVRISFVGYITKQLVVGTQTVINVQMESDAQQLEELVVVGYGTVKKSDLTGSVASITSEELNASPVTSADQALIGVAPGVRVVQSSGAPGSGTTIRIRGGNSITAGNEPLFVVDGMIGVGDLSSINPNDIESIEVLKDASSTAIYGARGANGVVMITTKRGKEGQNRFNYNGYVGVQSVFKTIDLMNASEFASLQNEVDVQEGLPPAFSNPSSLGEGTNWQDEIFRSAKIQNHQLSFSGGQGTAKYYVSANYFEQEGIILNSGFERFSLRFNLENDFANWLKVGTNSVLSRSINNQATISTLETLRFSPVTSIFDDNGNYELGTFDTRVIDNPVALANEPIDEITISKILSNLYGEATIMEGLKFKVSLGVDGSFNRRNIYRPRSLQEQASTGGSATITSAEYLSLLNENTLSYNKNLSERSFLDIVAGVSFQTIEYNDVSASGSSFTTDALTFNSLDNATSGGLPSSNITEEGLISYLARVNYILDNKYLFTFAGRYDGASNVAKANRWVFFPSAAFGWKLSEEDFLQNSNLIDELKFRTSFGVTGNREIDPYLSLATQSGAFYNFGGSLVSGFKPNRLSNQELKWEKTTQFDIGLDFSILSGRINGSIDYYRKTTNDLLFDVVVPSVSGFTSAVQNVGQVKNSGIEFNITTTNVDTDKFKWSTSFNISKNKNEVSDLGEVDEILTAFSTAGAGNQASGILRIGEPVGSFYGWISEGTWKSQSEIDDIGTMPGAIPGSERLQDVDGDGDVDGDDRVILGSSVPDFFGGITNKFSYGNFQLAIVTDFTSGNEVFNFTDSYLAAPVGDVNQYAEYVDRWSSSNNTSDLLGASVTAGGFDPKSRWIKDGSYFRFREISLGYNIPTDNIRWLQSANITLSGTNLIRFDNYNGYDPQVSGSGQDNLRRATDLGGYPTNKVYRLMVSLGF